MLVRQGRSFRPLVITVELLCSVDALAQGDISTRESTRSPAAECHTSYTGKCPPVNAGDVDCAGGRGNGPNFVGGPVTVVGPDVFRLDRDGDGIACEPNRR